MAKEDIKLNITGIVEDKEFFFYFQVSESRKFKTEADIIQHLANRGIPVDDPNKLIEHLKNVKSQLVTAHSIT